MEFYLLFHPCHPCHPWLKNVELSAKCDHKKIGRAKARPIKF